MGVLLRASSGIAGIDLDDYAEMIAEFPAIEKLMQQAKGAGVYCENSPSKTGLRLFVKGSLPEGKGRRQGGIEIYADTAFLTVTGVVRWPGDVIEAQWLVDALLGTIDDRPRQSGVEKAQSRDTLRSPPIRELLLSCHQRWSGSSRDYGVGNGSRTEAIFIPITLLRAKQISRYVDTLHARC